MKKLLLVLIFTTLVNFIFAQNSRPSSFQLGLRFAPSISWFNPNTKDYSSDGSSLKFSWGLLTDLRLTNNYFLSTGINFNTFGGKLKYPVLDFKNGSGNMKEIYSVKYLEIPVLLKMKTRPFGPITYYGEVGVGFGLMIKANADQEFSSSNTSYSILTNGVDVKSRINDFKMSLIIGAGIEYSLGGSTSLFAGLRFNNGFTNILNFNNNILPYTDATAVPNSVELAVGIIF